MAARIARFDIRKGRYGGLVGVARREEDVQPPAHQAFALRRWVGPPMIVYRIDGRKVRRPIIVELVVATDAEQEPEQQRDAFRRTLVDDAYGRGRRLEADLDLVHAPQRIAEHGVG